MAVTPWTLLDTAPVPGSTDQLRLLQRGREFSLRIGHGELMNSRAHGSEEDLATLACARLTGRKNVRVLVGGLGMGFTMRAALGVLGRDAKVVVAELVSAVVDWNCGPMAEFLGDPKADPRADIRVADVADLIRGERAAWDAILLDVDNSPEGLIRQANDRLYDFDGLRAVQTALRPGGILGVWSAGAEASFSRRLSQAGFAVDEVKVRGNGVHGGSRHVVWIAVRPNGRQGTGQK